MKKLLAIAPVFKRLGGNFLPPAQPQGAGGLREWLAATVSEIFPLVAKPFARYLEVARRLGERVDLGPDQKADLLLGAIPLVGLQGHGGRLNDAEGNILLLDRKHERALVVRSDGQIHYGNYDAENKRSDAKPIRSITNAK